MQVFDAHLDIFTHVASSDRDGSKQIFLNQHYPKLVAGETKVGIFVVYTEGDSVTEKYNQAIDILLAMSRELARNQAYIQPIINARDFEQVEAGNKLGIILGIEGMSFLEVNFDLLYLMARIGIRHGGLTWNETSSFATGASGEASRGLTERGVHLVAEMEKLHMIVDLAHANEKTFYDVHEIATRPCIVSHAGAWEIFAHPRNLKDEQLRVLAASGGIVGINAWRTFLAASDQSIDDFMKHLVHIVDTIGIQHVGFGFDFCDFLYGEMPNGKPLTKDLASSSDVQNVVVKLAEHGFNESEIQQLCYDNFAQFFKQWL